MFDKKINRRTFGRALAAGAGTALLAGCAISKDPNGKVVMTLNTKKVDAYAQAIENGGSALLSSPLITKALGAAVTDAVSKVVVEIAGLITSFDQATGGAATITFDDTSAINAANSILTDGQYILTTVQSALSSAQIADMPSAVQDVISALRTIVSLLQALLATAATRRVTVVSMPEADALRILKVKAA